MQGPVQGFETLEPAVSRVVRARGLGRERRAARGLRGVARRRARHGRDGAAALPVRRERAVVVLRVFLGVIFRRLLLLTLRSEAYLFRAGTSCSVRTRSLPNAVR